MENVAYYISCALALGGAFGLLISRNYVNAVMSMLVSIFGVAGLLFVMQAFFLSFIMVVVYAGAVMVLFIFAVMLVGDQRENAGIFRRLGILGLWVLLCLGLSYFALSIPEMRFRGGESVSFAPSVKDYGLVMFTKFLPMFEIVGAILLVAMVGVIVIAKDTSPARPKRDML